MELAFFVYGVSVLAKLGTLFDILMGVLVIYCALKTVNATFSLSDYDEKYRPETYQKNVDTLKFEWLKIPATVIILLGILTSLVPTEKTMYTALAAYISQSVVQSETADKVLNIVNGKLDEYLVEITTQVEKEKK